MIPIWTALFGFYVATTAAAIALVLVFDLTGATWWHPFERTLVRLSRAAALGLVLFLPLVSSVPSPWRSGIALAVISVLALVARRAPAPSLIALAFALTVVAWDCLMTREPHWVSDVYGLYVFASGFCAVLAFLAASAVRTGAKVEQLHALGKLFLCAILVWAYLAFFQLLLIWLPDLPREVGFYRARTSGNWAIATVLLGLGHFVLPFIVLLFRAAKRSPRALAVLGVLVLGACALDFAWLAVPA